MGCPAGHFRQNEIITISRESLPIRGGNPAAGGKMVRRAFNLSQTDRGRDVRHSVVIANYRKPIAALGIHALAA